MKTTLPLTAALLAGCAAPFVLAATAATAQEAAKPAAPSPGEIVDAAPVGDWVEIAAHDLMVMDLAPDAAGKPRRVVIQLIGAPFSQGWVDNIRNLVAKRYYDGLAVIRVQDNYVTQWGDPAEEEGPDVRPLPEGLKVMPESDYVVRGGDVANWQKFKDLTYPKGSISSYSAFSDGWPIVASGTPDSLAKWPTHCYGMVGVARDMSPNTGDGSSLYTVIGHAPRHLDRNIALAGRVIGGMEHLSALPRGSGPLGFYTEDETRPEIVSVRIADELPESERPRFAYLSTDSDAFARYADARANRRDPFFIVPAGGADICNIPVPVKAYPWVRPAG